MAKQLNLNETPAQFLNEQGELNQPLPATITNEDLVRFYRHMVLTRLMDQKAIALQRTGQIGTYASCLGQEAFSTAIGLTLGTDDVFVPYYRDQAAQLARGVHFHEMLLFWGGDERGSAFQNAPQNDLPNCIPIATQITHAAGIALAIKIKKQNKVVVTTCGDGATSRGDFAESINFAGVAGLPLLIVINNNKYAISTPLAEQTAAPTLAGKGVACGIEGIVIDGNDAMICLHTMHQALDYVREKKKPYIIEAVSYRLSDHTTADDATRYTDKSELKRMWATEPIGRLQKYLSEAGVWDKDKELAMQNEFAGLITSEVEAYRNTPPEKAAAIFDYLYERLPLSLSDQKDALNQKERLLQSKQVAAARSEGGK